MTKALRRALGALLGAFVRLWLMTLRLTFVADPKLGWAGAGSSGGPSSSALDQRAAPWVLALWHGQQLPLYRWIRRRTTVVLVSLSDDGELLAGAMPLLGYEVTRGSTSRGGARGLRALARRMRAGADGALAVDGPKGPRRVVQTGGAAALARLSKGVVVPMASACSASWVLSRTWDAFEIPKPFAKVAVVLGAPLSPDEAEPKALGVAIEAARAWAEEIIGSRRAALPTPKSAGPREGPAEEVLP